MRPELKGRLQTYHDLLLKWQKSVNLVAPSTVLDAWSRHFEDSLQVLDYIPETTTALADMGSGAGFPGLVIAIARPDIQVHLIESDNKKASFLKTVSRETKALNVQVYNGRIESVLPTLRVDVVTARALAALPQLLQLTRSQRERESPALCLFMKGENWRSEVEMARADHLFDFEVHASKTAPSAAILCIRGIAPGHDA